MENSAIKPRQYLPGTIWLLQCALVAAGYFLTGVLGLSIPYVGSQITLVWLPTGIAVAALYRWGYGVWPGVWLGSLLVTTTVSSSWAVILGISIGNTLGPLLATFLLLHHKFNPEIRGNRDVWLYLFSAALGMTLSASGGVITLFWNGLLSADAAWFAWLSWWAGDTVGLLLIGLLLINVSTKNLKNSASPTMSFSLLLLLLLLSIYIFFYALTPLGRPMPVLFLTMPLLVWIALQEAMMAAMLAAIIPSFVAVVATSLGMGQFGIERDQDSLVMLWLYMVSLVFLQLIAISLQAQRRESLARIESLAYFDHLTQLPNRNLLMDRLHHALQSVGRTHEHGALMFMDLDHFKNINDAYGHHAGDLLLVEVAARLGRCVRQEDSVCRISGDEFVVLLEHLSENAVQAANQAEMVAEKMRGAVNEDFHLAVGLESTETRKIQHHSSVSIGIVLFDASNTIDELLKRADLTMYQAKAAGRNGIRFFDPAMQKVVDERATLEQELRKAVSKMDFQLHYQLQFDAEGGVVGCEALLRWPHATRGFIAPDQFVPLAEETGLILPIGRWVIEQACRQLVEWAQHPKTKELTIAVNVSARQFRECEFVQDLIDLTRRFNVDPALLKIELTESVVLSNVEDGIHKIERLKHFGAGVALDDFGTGYSSLSYLQRLPIDQLKIDRSFVRDLEEDSQDAAIVRAVMALASALALDVVAEGVETEAQRQFLADLGCPVYQGYFFARPEPIELVNRRLGI